MGMFLRIFWPLVQLGPDYGSLDSRTKSSNRLALKNKIIIIIILDSQ